MIKNDFLVTKEALDTLQPSLLRSFPISCFDSKFSLGDGSHLNIVSSVVNNEFLAFDRRINLDDGGIEYLHLRSYPASRLRSYKFDPKFLPVKTVLLKTNANGVLTAVDENGKVLTGEALSGLRFEIPYLEIQR